MVSSMSFSATATRAASCWVGYVAVIVVEGGKTNGLPPAGTVVDEASAKGAREKASERGRGRQSRERRRARKRPVRSPVTVVALHFVTAVDDHALPTLLPTDTPPHRARESRCGNVPCVGNSEDSLDRIGACPFPSRLNSHVCERQCTTNTSRIDSMPSSFDHNRSLDWLSIFL